MEEQNEYSIFPERPVVYGTFWARFFAALLDAIIIGVPMSIISTLLFPVNDITVDYGNYFVRSGTSNLLQLIAGWLYSALMESGPGMATLGKRALGLKVTTADGDRISFGQATGRHFGKIISTIILCIGFLMMLWDDRRQTLHDKMTRTLVVSSK